MARKTKIMSFSLSPEMAEEIEQLAKQERRSKSELLREMVRVYEEYLAEKEWQTLFAFGEKTAKRLVGIKDEKELFKILNSGTGL